MPYIDSLRVFARVVELGSITSGGRDLRMTPAVASKRIKELEAHLGVRLFNRTTRRLSPTEVGRVFYDEARKVLETVEIAEAAVASYSSARAGWCGSRHRWAWGGGSSRRWCRSLSRGSPTFRFRCGFRTGWWTS